MYRDQSSHTLHQVQMTDEMIIKETEFISRLTNMNFMTLYDMISVFYVQQLSTFKLKLILTLNHHLCLRKAHQQRDTPYHFLMDFIWFTKCLHLQDALLAVYIIQSSVITVQIKNKLTCKRQITDKKQTHRFNCGMCCKIIL